MRIWVIVPDKQAFNDSELSEHSASGPAQADRVAHSQFREYWGDTRDKTGLLESLIQLASPRLHARLYKSR